MMIQRKQITMRPCVARARARGRSPRERAGAKADFRLFRGVPFKTLTSYIRRDR